MQNVKHEGTVASLTEWKIIPFCVWKSELLCSVLLQQMCRHGALKSLTCNPMHKDGDELSDFVICVL